MDLIELKEDLSNPWPPAMVNGEFLQAIQEKYVNTHLSEEC